MKRETLSTKKLVHKTKVIGIGRVDVIQIMSFYGDSGSQRSHIDVASLNIINGFVAIFRCLLNTHVIKAGAAQVPIHKLIHGSHIGTRR